MHTKEADIWPLIRKGDQKAYESSFRKHYTMLCHYAAPIIRDHDEAEEAVQNVFYNIWAKRETLEITGSLKAYLYRAVHNECLNKLKHTRVKEAYAADYRAVGQVHSAASTPHEQKELGKQISEAIEKLPEQCGNVFRLSRFEHLSYAEIAGQLGISIKTVESHMGKALKMLRESLKEYLPLVMWLFMIN